MLPELLAWFSTKDANKRKYPRKRKPYRASYTVAGTAQKIAIGLDMSGGGCCVITQENVAQRELDLLALIETRTVKVRAKTVWQDNVNHRGRRVWRYGMQFTGIRADDWDAIMRYTVDKSVDDANKTVEELTKVRMTPDDTARLLPLALQKVLLGMLVQRGRLAPLDDKVTPLVQYFYSGLVKYETKLLHRLTIQSKVVGFEAKPELFETLFMFDDDGKNIKLLEPPAPPPPKES